MKKSIVTGLLLAVIATGCTKTTEGPAGKDGNANVVNDTYSVSDWQSNSSRWYAVLSVPALTAENINSAAVQVYIGTTSNNWLAIPATVEASTNYFWGFVTTIGQIEAQWVYNGFGIGDDPNEFYGTTVQIKVVVIPPAEAAKHPDVDLADYEKVKETFRLAE